MCNEGRKMLEILLVAYGNVDLVDVYYLGSVIYCFVLWSNLGIHALQPNGYNLYESLLNYTLFAIIQKTNTWLTSQYTNFFRENCSSFFLSTFLGGGKKLYS